MLLLVGPETYETVQRTAAIWGLPERVVAEAFLEAGQPVATPALAQTLHHRDLLKPHDRGAPDDEERVIMPAKTESERSGGAPASCPTGRHTLARFERSEPAATPPSPARHRLSSLQVASKLTCPVCGGGQSQRCQRMLGNRSVLCTSEEHARSLPIDARFGGYVHHVNGPCPCGAEHRRA